MVGMMFFRKSFGFARLFRGVALSRRAGKKKSWVNIHQWLDLDTSESKQEWESDMSKEGKSLLKTRPEYLSFCRFSLSTLISLPSPRLRLYSLAFLSSNDFYLSSRPSVSFLITSVLYNLQKTTTQCRVVLFLLVSGPRTACIPMSKM